MGTAFRARGPRAVALVHLAALAIAGLALVGPRPFSVPPVPDQVTLTGTLWLMATQLGLPVIALAMTAPAVQAWVTTLGPQPTRSTYGYYAASNVGSLAGLLAYPWLIEPRFPLSGQWDLWRRGLWLLGAVAALLWLSARFRSRPTISPQTAPAPGWRDRIEWMVRAAIPLPS